VRVAALGVVAGAALILSAPSASAQCNSNFVGAGITPVVNGDI
jgi:hypothetical protein